jgi:hypothetical protein
MPQTNPSRERVLLGLLHSVERDAIQSQRSLASEFGVALGMVNTCLRYCVRKGYVRVKRIPARRYAYFVTPKGIMEKSRLTAAHLSSSLSFFRQAREDCRASFRMAQSRGWRRLALVGAGELADIAMLCAEGEMIDLVGMVDDAYPKSLFRKLPVTRTVASLPPVDGLIVTEMHTPQATYNRLVSEIDPQRVLSLAVLHITPITEKPAEHHWYGKFLPQGRTDLA